jgi:3-oxoacyl-[acyl-carrier protein] reductase
VTVAVNGRSEDRTNAVVSEMSSRWPGQAIAVCGDVNTNEGRRALLEVFSNPDILVTNNAGPTPASFGSLDEQKWLDAINACMISPLLLIRGVVPGMIERKFGRIVNITSAMVTTPRPSMALSSGAKAGLTAALKGLIFEVARFNVTINNLLPERFDTDRQVQMAQAQMARSGLTWGEARTRQIESIPARRLGKPHEFGETCAFVCSAQASYMTGMNIRLDGGSYPALL